MTRSTDKLLLLAVLVVALVIRFAHFLAIEGTASLKAPLVFDRAGGGR